MESSKPIATSSSTPLQGSGGQPSSDRSKQQASAKAELPSSPSSGTLPVLPLVSSSPPASSPNLSTPSSQPPQSGPSKKATQEQKKVATSTIDVSSSLSALYKDLFETQKHADINVLVGLSRKKFTAHSIVLMVHSPVLEAMIVKNSQPTVKDVTIVLPKGEPLIFETLLKYFYTGVAEIDEVTVLALMEIAQNLQVDRLVDECAKFITENIKPRVATDYLELAAKLGRQLLYKHCLEYIQVNFDKVSVTKSFLAISEKSFDAVIRSHLVRADEVNIFKAILTWGQHKIEQKQKIQKSEDGVHEGGYEVTLHELCAKLLVHVRYALMSPQDIFKVVHPSKLIPLDQLFLVLAHHHLPNDFPVLSLFPPPLVEFDPEKCSEDIEISADNQTATLMGEKNAGSVVLVKKPLTTDDAYVEVSVEKLQQPGYIGLGLSTEDISYKHIYCTSKSDRWMVYFSQKGISKLFGQTLDGTPFGKAIQQGDKIGVQFYKSPTGSELKFFHNGEELGVAFRGFTGKFFLAVFLYYVGDRVTIN